MKWPWYQRVLEEASDEDKLAYSLLEESCRRCESALIFWKSVAALFMFIGAVQIFTLQIEKSNFDFSSYGFSTGWRTEMEDSRPLISIEETHFTGGLRESLNGTLFAHHDEPEPIYAAPPSAEIDAAWNDLLGSPYLALTNEEIAALEEDEAGHVLTTLPALSILHRGTRINLRSGVYGTFGLMYQLDCLDMLRKHLDPGYYGEYGHSLKEKRPFLDHCVDTLRQALMCYGDTTPVPMVPYRRPDGQFFVFGDIERTRTCRNSKGLLEYSKARSKIPVTLESQDLGKF